MKRLRLRARRQYDSRRSVWDWFFDYLNRRSSFDRLLFGLVLCISLVSGGYLLWQLNTNLQQTVLSTGGTLHEGIVGIPRFINPVLATTRADQDLVALLYRGLYTYDATGALVPDLAESLTISEDGRTYNIKIKPGQYWHDGVEITAGDIVYTLSLIQNPELRSPIRGNWNDVAVEEIGSYEINLVLEEPYAPFIENLTLGILPRHLWQHFTPDEFPFSQYNTEPVGSGPFQLVQIERNEDGIATAYHLSRFQNYKPSPAINQIVLHFFTDETAAADALTTGTITHTAALRNDRVATLRDQYQVYERPLPRVFGLYPNQNRSAVLRDLSVRAALSAAINRQQLVTVVLGGFGVPVTTPLPAGFTPFASSTPPTEDATSLLLAGGWKQTESGGWEKEIDGVRTPLAVTITTANTPLFTAIADIVKETWEQLGVTVTIAMYEQSDLIQAIIRPRDYELLLFGTDIGRALDLYPFWHSSQREDPGLNVAQYTNITIDEVLEEYRATSDANRQQELLQTFVDIIASEQPAIFLFTPTFTYVTSSDTPLTIPDRIGKPSDRFALIHTWHIESESLWPIFITDTESN